MSLTPTPYDRLSAEQLSRDPHEPLYPRQEGYDSHSPEPKGGLLSPLFETAPRTMATLAVGVAAVAGVYNSPKIAERLSNLAHAHEVDKSKTVDNARSPLAGYSHVTNTLTYKTPDMSGK
jgi:hypothetical protein